MNDTLWCKFSTQRNLTPGDLNWVKHWVSRIGLLEQFGDLHKINQATLFQPRCLCAINQSNYPLQSVFGFSHKPIKLLHSLDQSNKEFRKTVLYTMLLPIWFACCFLSVASILCGSSSGKVNKRGEGEWTANYVLASGKAIPTQGAKKVSFTACHSCKLLLACTSSQVISTSPHTLFDWQDWLQSFCNLISPNNSTCPSGKLRTKITGSIAKSTSPGLSDMTFFARCPQ